MIEVLRLNFDKYSNAAAVSVTQALLRQNKLNIDQRVQVRDMLYKIVKFPRARDPSVRSHAAKVLADIAILDWPDYWPSFIDDVLPESLHPILGYVSEKLNSDFSIPTNRRNYLKYLLVERLADIFQVMSIDAISHLFMWLPVDPYIDEKILQILTTKCPIPGSKCLYTLFIERDDSKDLFERFSTQILYSLAPITEFPVLRVLASLFQKYLPFIFSKEVNLRSIDLIIQHLAKPGWCINEAYFEYWESFLEFFCRKEDPIILHNTVRDHMIELCNFMVSALEPDSEKIVSDSSRKCMKIMCHEIPDYIYSQLMESPLDKTLCLFASSVVRRLPKKKYIKVIERMMALSRRTRDMVVVELMIQTLASACYYYGENDFILITFVMTMRDFLKTKDTVLHNSVITSLRFISENFPEAFFFKNGTLIEMIIDYTQKFQPDTWNSSFALPFYEVICVVLSSNKAEAQKQNRVSRTFERAIYAIVNGTPDIQSALHLFSDICVRSNIVSKKYGKDLLSVLPLYVCNEEMGEHALIVSSAILCDSPNWDLICDDFETIFVNGSNTYHPELMLDFLTKVQSMFPEVTLNFDRAYNLFCEPLINNVCEFTGKAFSYMKMNFSYIFNYPLPINSIKEALDKYPLSSASGIRLIDEYLCRMTKEKLFIMLQEIGPEILDTLSMCIFDTRFQNKLKRSITTFVHFGIAFAIMDEQDLPQSKFVQQFKDITLEIAPHISIEVIDRFTEQFFDSLGYVDDAEQLVSDFVLHVRQGK